VINRRFAHAPAHFAERSVGGGMRVARGGFGHGGMIMRR
jgi:hypothetical protein